MFAESKYSLNSKSEYMFFLYLRDGLLTKGRIILLVAVVPIPIPLLPDAVRDIIGRESEIGLPVELSMIPISGS